MLIFGRSPNLVLAAITAVFNVFVVFHIGGFNPTLDQVAVANALFAALVALIAGTDSFTRAAGVAAEDRQK